MATEFPYLEAEISCQYKYYAKNSFTFSFVIPLFYKEARVRCATLTLTISNLLSVLTYAV